jgi:hypothetical protein
LDNDCDSSTNDTCEALCTAFQGDEHPYMLCASPLEWTSAAEACAAQGMQLARIDTEEENLFLVESLQDIEIVWIGANDRDKEGTWEWSDGEPFWVDDEAVADYTAWYQPGGPTGGSSENCGELWNDETWEDYACAVAQAFICERY